MLDTIHFNLWHSALSQRRPPSSPDQGRVSVFRGLKGREIALYQDGLALRTPQPVAPTAAPMIQVPVGVLPPPD